MLISIRRMSTGMQPIPMTQIYKLLLLQYWPNVILKISTVVDFHLNQQCTHRGP
jgi:hypothetical protein